MAPIPSFICGVGRLDALLGSQRRAPAWAGVLLMLLAGCTTSGPEAVNDASRGGQPQSEASQALVVLAVLDLEAGRLDEAERRYRSAAQADPGSPVPWAGLARVALARHDPAAARAALEEAKARNPDHAEVALSEAGLAIEAGRPDDARRALDRALAADPGHLLGHAMLEELTGSAPPGRAPDLASALARVLAHPYDPRALLQAGRRALAADRPELAVMLFDRAVASADRAPRAAFAALAELQRIDDAWAARMIVPVHVFVDDTVAVHGGWRPRLRNMFRSLSAELDPVLAVALVPVSMQAFSTADLGGSLPAMHARLDATASGSAPRGIVAGFTERGPPAGTRTPRLGQAGYMGRSLVVRLEPGELRSRVFAHELLHLYGGVHVSPEFPSIMNPSGEDHRLDPANRRILEATRVRTFGPGGPERNVFARVDRPELIAALQQALALNMAFRRLGLAEAHETRDSSRKLAARKAREAAALDDQLADVAHLLAGLLAVEGRLGQATQMLDLAAVLYGPRTPAGRDAARRAERLRSAAPGS